MITHHFSPVGGITTYLTLNRKGNKTEIPYDHYNGWLQSLLFKDVVTIIVSIDPSLDHECYTLDNKGNKTPKKAIGVGTYEKRLTVNLDENEKKGIQVAKWPDNMICVGLGDVSYNIGIFRQLRQFYFVIQEFRPDPPEKTFKSGEVKWFSLLKGYGAVASGNPLFDHRIYWAAVPKRENQLRYLNSGDMIDIKELTTPDMVKTTFMSEIVAAEIV